MRKLALLAVLASLAGSVYAQEFPKPGPEHEMLKKREGKWEGTMSFGGMDSKVVTTSKMELGDFWLLTTSEIDFGGTKFTSKVLETYDIEKKKFTSVRLTSMSPAMVILEGSYDKDKKTTTLTGDGPGFDGKTVKYKIVSEMKDADTQVESMYFGDGKDPVFTTTNKRKK